MALVEELRRLSSRCLSSGRSSSMTELGPGLDSGPEQKFDTEFFTAASVRIQTRPQQASPRISWLPGRRVTSAAASII